MLVLTRKIGEKIVIGKNITVTVIGIGPNRVRLGIVAPEDVRIDRQEIHEKIAAEAAAAAAPQREVAPTAMRPPTTAHKYAPCGHGYAPKCCECGELESAETHALAKLAGKPAAPAPAA